MGCDTETYGSTLMTYKLVFFPVIRNVGLTIHAADDSLYLPLVHFDLVMSTYIIFHTTGFSGV